MKLTLLRSSMLCILAITVYASAEKTVTFRTVAEFGFLNVASHKVQFGEDGTYFDYPSQGGQDVLFPFNRFSAEMAIGSNTFILLYQPLQLETTDLLEKDVTIDGYTFERLSGLRCLYGFPFYRASYLRELFPENNHHSLALGLTLQIRNATISFESVDGDGTGYRTNRDIGLVPAFKVRGTLHLSKNYFLGLEADGIYAPVSYLNGSDNEVVGAILDASVRAGTHVRLGDLFVNLRYLGGGATGTSTKDVWPGDGYVKNWLHFFIGSLGFVYTL